MAAGIGFLSTKRIVIVLNGTCMLTFVQKVSAFTRLAITKQSMPESPGKKPAKNIACKSNLVFPGILKGNEAQVLPYMQKFSCKRRNYLLRMHDRGKTFLPAAAAIFKKYDLPSELKILITLESAYNANAVSRTGAVGYWQIMDEVALEYGLRYIAWAEKKKFSKIKGKRKAGVQLRDDRKNFILATNAAARYLRDRRKNLDDNWLLVVASYNCGVGNVWSAMEKTGKSNPDFWDIKNHLPA